MTVMQVIVRVAAIRFRVPRARMTTTELVGTPPGVRFDGDPGEAEADLRRASDALGSRDEALSAARARAEEIEDESFDDSPEAEAEFSRRMQAAEREIESLQEARDEAEEDLFRAVAYWENRGHLSP